MICTIFTATYHHGVRLAYVCYWFLLENDGVAYKIDAQVDRWRTEGHHAEVFCLTRRGASRRGWRTIEFDGGVGRALAMRRLVHDVDEWSPDAVYLRYDFFGPPVPRLLRSRASVVEINADDRREARLRARRPLLARAFNELNREALFRSARGLACVTHELAAAPHVTRFGKPTVVVGNGVDLSQVSEVPAPGTGGDLRAVFLGSSGQRWHGVDKIAQLAQRLPDVQFDVIGYRPQAVNFPVHGNMNVHPPLSRQEYEPLLARADVAIGTLALHRKQMTEACPLKVREYLAHGLPTVIAYDDTDFLDVSPWFLLKLPNEESNVVENVDAIRSFMEGVRGRRVARAEVAERIGSQEKERRRLAFIAGLTR
jgi:glycosyltransferase involved in cell wall biosynthesis